MDYVTLTAAADALLIILDPVRMMFLASGVLIGLVLGLLPGVGGTIGLAILLPFTFAMDPFTALAFLLGLSAVTATGDTIPAVLFGVPGTSGAQATILDGLPMTKKGEAGRALSAAYTASLIGGVFGALVLAVAIPVIRPLIMHIGIPELLAMTILGISVVAILSGKAPLRGLAAGGIGIMLAMVGSDQQTGTLRWTFDTIYLWDGLPLIPMTLGLFALPELCDLATRRSSMTNARSSTRFEGIFQGAQDTLRNWWLVARCSSLGSAVGAIPGLGSSVVDWFAYGHALRSEKRANESFGKGDVRGVIAPESANSALQGGALVPTIAFGIPGSTGMAILLGAFVIHGLVPGPDMLGRHLDITYSMVWSVAIANIIGAGLCFLFSGYFARIATLRYTLIIPFILIVMYVGVFKSTQDWNDIIVLLIFGAIGWVMKQLKWPRPPLILGFVLGALVERYFYISLDIYGWTWLTRPAVIVILLLALWGLLRPLMSDLRALDRGRFQHGQAWSRLMKPEHLFHLAIVGMILWLLQDALAWPYASRIVPIIVGTFVIAMVTLSLLGAMASPLNATRSREQGQIRHDGQARESGRMHMDLESDFGDIPLSQILLRAAKFFGWIILFALLMHLVGILITIPIFVILFMRNESREAWRLVLPYAIAMTAFVYLMFDRIFPTLWPRSLAGELFPHLRFIPTL